MGTREPADRYRGDHEERAAARAEHDHARRDEDPVPLPKVPPLDRCDYAMLDALLAHRVLTTDQMALVCGRPLRTVLYRLDRLYRARLVKRQRPYASEGSAPLHWWLTTRGRRLAGGTGRSRGEHRDPTFLAHTAATAALPVTLAATPPPGLTLVSWVRDEDAWESYDTGYADLLHRSAPKIRPDGLARIVVNVRDDVPLPVFVEIDLDTSSAGKLAAKVPRYLDYANERAWQGRHPVCPALLLLTPLRGRADAFLAAATTYRREHFLSQAHEDMTVAVCAAVHDTATAVAAPVWRTAVDATPVPLRDVLAAHLRAVDPEVRRLARVRAEEQAAERAW